MFDFLFVPLECYRVGVFYFLLHILFFYRKISANLAKNSVNDKGALWQRYPEEKSF